jgi:hypothetical protein
MKVLGLPSAIASPQAILSPILAAGLPSMKVLDAPLEGERVDPAWQVGPQQ